jgi:probable F420-dependent oxidoreductase
MTALHASSNSLRVGVVFPHTELSGDPVAIREFAQACESLGFDHIVAFDHVLGAHPDTPGYAGKYTSETPFTEPFVLFSYMAALTARIELVTGVLVLPQRQTALVAKQAADLALLSDGRLRLGVGTGWSQREYEALGTAFSGRGARQEAQIALLRRLWTEETITLHDTWHELSDVGILPRPASRIPIWFGGNSPAVIRRAARLGDGWFPLARPGLDLEPLLERLYRALDDAGRERDSFGIEGFINAGPADPDRWVRQLDAWSNAGATHVSLRTQPPVLPNPRPGVGLRHHLDLLERFASAAGLVQRLNSD